MVKVCLCVDSECHYVRFSISLQKLRLTLFRMYLSICPKTGETGLNWGRNGKNRAELGMVGRGLSLARAELSKPIKKHEGLGWERAELEKD
jgi:hypothetical protein